MTHDEAGRPAEAETDLLTDGPRRRWAELHAAHGYPVNAGAIRVMLIDVDGVLTPGEGHPAELDVLARATELNRQALIDPAVPALTLCTGRQAPYVEAMAQLIGAFLPCSFEHGAGLFDPVRFRYSFHPALGDEYALRLCALRSALMEPVFRAGLAFAQPGKEASMSLFPLGGTPLATIAAVARRVVADLGGAFEVAENVTGIELRPAGIDKGAGARWLSDLLNLPLDQFAGVGDSQPDLTFLSIVGYPAAPANAVPIVKEGVQDVASLPYGAGLLEIIDRIIARNRSL